MSLEAGEIVASSEKAKLQKNFRRFDVFFFLISALVGVDTIGSAAKNGAQGFTWLIFLGIAFFVPYGLITAELGSSFTGEGGCLVWTRDAFGGIAAAIVAFFYWISTPIWVGGTLFFTAIAASDAFFGKMPNAGRYLFGAVFVWFTVLAAILSLRVGKWIPNIGAWTRFLVLGFFTITVALYAARNGLHGFTGHSFLPTYGLFITVAPVLVFNYVGFELPSSAGDEMTNPRKDVPFAVALSAIGSVLMYGVPILAILLVLPQQQITGLNGFIDAIKAAFTVYGGHVAKDGVVLTGAGQGLGAVAAVLFIVSVISSGSTWLIGSDRVLAVAGYSGIAPRILGRFSANLGTPIVVNLLSGVVATVVMIAASVLAGQDSKKFFDAVLGLAISTTTISYLAIFPAAIRLRYTHAGTDRPYRVPGGMAGIWVCGILATFWTAVATLGQIWPGLGVGWFNSGGDPNGSLPTGFTRAPFETTQVVPILLILILSVAMYGLARANAREGAA